jgi:S-adenosylmethionine:tRNA-ribosyltransferase-isomerase (queuine synthetase)
LSDKSVFYLLSLESENLDLICFFIEVPSSIFLKEDYENKLNKILAKTQIIIAPGYQLKIANAIITNFHQPESTLAMMISAFMGYSRWKDSYQYAIEQKYRFFSYGDAQLILF